MTEAVIGWARERGAGRLQLFSTPAADPLYLALGFTRHVAPALRRRLTDR